MTSSVSVTCHQCYHQLVLHWRTNIPPNDFQPEPPASALVHNSLSLCSTLRLLRSTAYRPTSVLILLPVWSYCFLFSAYDGQPQFVYSFRLGSPKQDGAVMTTPSTFIVLNVMENPTINVKENSLHPPLMTKNQRTIHFFPLFFHARSIKSTADSVLKCVT